MKKVILITLIICLGAGFAAAQTQKTGAVGLMFTDSVAFGGLNAEIFLGNLGIGGTFTFLPLGTSDAMVIFYEPGIYGRFYMGDIESCMYLTGGVTYMTAAGGSADSGSFEGADAGVLNINAGVGYNSLFGKNNATRFSIEVGPRYSNWIADDSTFYEGFFLHLGMYFGATF